MKSFFQISDSQKGHKKSLDNLTKGDFAEILNIEDACTGPIRRRLLDLGFVPGTKVEKLGEGLFGGPSRFSIRGNVIALRAEQAAQILTQE